MIIITLEQIQEVYHRRPREETFEKYLEQFVEQLEAMAQLDGTFKIDDDLNEYIWTAAWETRTAEEYQERIKDLKKTFQVMVDLENGKLKYSEDQSQALSYLDSPYITKRKLVHE